MVAEKVGEFSHMPRTKIESRTATVLMFASDMTCNRCMKEHNHLEIHHINGNPRDHRYDNLILLCRNCHSEVTAKGLGRMWSPALLLKYKNYWEEVVRKRRSANDSGDRGLEARLVRNGAEKLATLFENYMLKRDAPGVLSLFTPPSTKAERGWLENYILGGDLGKPGESVRLFATRGFGYKVLKYDIKNLRVVNPKRAEVAIEEWRTWWDDGKWHPVPNRCNTRLTLVKVGNDWFVDKYRDPSAPHYRHKYGALGG